MKKPNICIFMTDQQRYDTVPPYRLCAMPNLERFSEEATNFMQNYCPSPHCCPSRASFFSGLYPSEHGVWNNVNVGNALSRGLAEDVKLWSEDLKENGYKMFFSGKWHVSAEEGPQDRGFETVFPVDSYTGVQSAARERVPKLNEWDPYRKADRKESGRRQPGELTKKGYPEYLLYGNAENPFGDGDVTEYAVSLIRDKLGEEKDPWCLFVGTLGPHDPYQPPREFLEWYEDKEIELPSSFHDDLTDRPALYRRTRDIFKQLSDEEYRDGIRHYRAFCSYEDFLFGRLINALKEQGIYDDTVIIYLSDHGDYAGAHGLWTKGLPCFQEAYHIPLLIHLPGQKKKRQIFDFTNLTDLAPTILKLAGISFENRFSGRSLTGYLSGEDSGAPQPVPYVYTQTNGNELYGIQRSVMSREWKYVYNGFDYDELYHLTDDPGEQKNLIADSRLSQVVQELSKELWLFAYRHKDTCITPYITVELAEYGPGIAFGPEKK
ncbi:MAG TPA: sulfatase-like hydrolase/transferase [Candidatus Eisenbergiella merdavium]|uniref:Sulfatase-like hydrolase/transferase n=1 Tax=Candidatus Eisenbergiella merdavium TaxID=2838551 RepID=A0A9D2NGC8_9FIRM|nr:sulfatase-like hydrolase/transferase [Candidatus Eisenbergiella merdavium]